MNTLREDLDEVADAPERVRRFVRSARRANGIAPGEQTCWFAYLECGRDSHMVTLGRSPADVIVDAKMYAEAHGYYRRLGTGRWIIESAAGDEDAESLLLVVRAKIDEVQA